MKSNPVCKYKWHYTILSLFIFLNFGLLCSYGAGSNLRYAPVSIKAENKPLTQIFKELSEISGYKIQFNNQWGDVPVNLNFKNVPLDKALNRILAKLNHAVIFNEEEKKITIFILGKADSGGPASSYSPGSSGGNYPGDSGREESGFEPMPSGEGRTTPGEEAEKIAPFPSRTPRQGAPAVSVTGRKTRFGQSTSTIE